MPEKFTITGWIKKSLKEGFPNTVRENRWILIGVVTIFLVSIGVALVALSIGDNPVARFIQERFGIVLPIWIFDGSFLEYTIHIFKANFSITSINIVSGLAFGVYPIYTVSMNGLMIGNSVSSGILFSFRGLSIKLFHSVFEIPGFIISASCGVRLGLGSIKCMLNRDFVPLREGVEDAIHLILPAFLLITVGIFTEALVLTYGDFILSSLLAQIVLNVVSLSSFAVIILWMGGKLS